MCERFAEKLTPLIGDAGVAAICARSLHLIQRSVPGLAPASATEGDAPFSLLQRVILMTARGTPEVTKGALDLGAYEVMHKPFELHDLEPLLLKAFASSAFRHITGRPSPV